MVNRFTTATSCTDASALGQRPNTEAVERPPPAAPAPPAPLPPSTIEMLDGFTLFDDGDDLTRVLCHGDPSRKTLVTLHRLHLAEELPTPSRAPWWTRLFGADTRATLESRLVDAGIFYPPSTHRRFLRDRTMREIASALLRRRREDTATATKNKRKKKTAESTNRPEADQPEHYDRDADALLAAGFERLGRVAMRGAVQRVLVEEEEEEEEEEDHDKEEEEEDDDDRDLGLMLLLVPLCGMSARDLRETVSEGQGVDVPAVSPLSLYAYDRSLEEKWLWFKSLLCTFFAFFSNEPDAVTVRREHLATLATDSATASARTVTDATALAAAANASSASSSKKRTPPPSIVELRNALKKARRAVDRRRGGGGGGDGNGGGGSRGRRSDSILRPRDGTVAVRWKATEPPLLSLSTPSESSEGGGRHRRSWLSRSFAGRYRSNATACWTRDRRSGEWTSCNLQTYMAMRIAGVAPRLHRLDVLGTPTLHWRASELRGKFWIATDPFERRDRSPVPLVDDERKEQDDEEEEEEEGQEEVDDDVLGPPPATLFESTSYVHVVTGMPFHVVAGCSCSDKTIAVF